MFFVSFEIQSLELIKFMLLFYSNNKYWYLSHCKYLDYYSVWFSINNYCSKVANITLSHDKIVLSWTTWNMQMVVFTLVLATILANKSNDMSHLDLIMWQLIKYMFKLKLKRVNMQFLNLIKQNFNHKIFFFIVTLLK